MAFQKKAWTDRRVENPGRRRLIPVSGQANVYDVVREEGAVAAEGDPFNQAVMNDLENRIERATTVDTRFNETSNNAIANSVVAKKIKRELHTANILVSYWGTNKVCYIQDVKIKEGSKITVCPIE